MKKICFLTTSRADFGVMEQLIKDVINSKKFNVHLIVSGSHTEKIFGNTQKEIFEKKCFVKKIKVISKNRDSKSVALSFDLLLKIILDTLK